jgi:hypothetical protein
MGGLNRPGGNLTGVTILENATSGKRLELLHELVPTASISYLASIRSPKRRSLRLRRVPLAFGCTSLMYAIKMNSRRRSWHSSANALAQFWWAQAQYLPTTQLSL